MNKNRLWIGLGVVALVLAGVLVWRIATMQPPSTDIDLSGESTLDKASRIAQQLLGISKPKTPEIGKGTQQPATLRLPEATPEADKETAPPPPAPPALPEPAANQTAAEPRTEVATEESGIPPDASGQDKVVRFAFVDELARLVVANYFPKGTHPEAQKAGVLLADTKLLNMEFGFKLTGLETGAEDPEAARTVLFDYALAPAVQRMLFSLYADRFVEALRRHAEAETRPSPTGSETRFTPDEVAELQRLASGRAKALGAALAAVSETGTFAERAAAYRRAAQAALGANSQFIRFLNSYQALRDEQATAPAPDPGLKKRIAEAEADMQRAGDEYQRAIVFRERAMRALVELVRRRPAARTLPDGECLYVALWAYRRVEQHPDRAAWLATSAELLHELSGKLAP